MASAGAAWDAIAAGLREGLRALSRSRGFAAAAILVLGLGVAAVTVAFAIVNGVVLRPLPFKDSGRLVMSLGAVGPADFADIRERNSVFTRMTYAGLGRGIVRGPNGPERVWTMAVRPSFFPMMGLTPSPGRPFTPQEYAAGGREAVIISSLFRVRQFGPDARFLGRDLDLDSAERVVVGATPAGFRYRFEWLYPAVSVWVPLALGPGQARRRGVAALSPGGRGGESYFTFFIARLETGLSLRRAQRGLDRVVAGILAAHPEDQGLRGLRLIRLKALWAGPAAKEVWPVFDVSLLFLVLGCANLTGLMLARRLAREREAAVRAALGAGPGRLAVLFLAEGLWIGAAGAAVGAALSCGAIRLFRAGAPAGLLPRLAGVAVNWHVVAFAAAASVLGALLAALAAALAQGRTAPAVVLARVSGAAPASSASGPGAGAKGLVFAQCAIATVLLATTGLMLGSVGRLSDVRLGFRPAGVIQAELAPAAPARAAWSRAHYARLWTGLEERLATAPGIRSAALAGFAYGAVPPRPFRVPAPGGGILGAGTAAWLDVSPGYFRTLRIPLLRGRAISRRDDLGAPAVAVVNRAFERRYLHNRSAIGREVELQLSSRGGWDPFRIIGAAGDTSMAGAWQAAQSPEIYTSMLQFPVGATLLARPAPGAFPNPEAFAKAVSADLGGGFVVQHAASLRRVISGALRRPRFLGQSLAVLAALALLLAFAGVYSVAAVGAGLKAKELGIRRALGASRTGLAARLVRELGILGAVGAACGLVLAAWLAGVLRAWLFGLRPTGVAAFALAAAGVILACAAAALLPAVRALRGNPARILRAE